MACNIQKIDLMQNQTGDEEGGKRKSDSFCLYSLMIPMLLFRYIDLLNTVLPPVGSIPANGLDHLPPQDVYSKSSQSRSCNARF